VTQSPSRFEREQALRAARLGTTRSMSMPGEGPNVPQIGRIIPVPDVPVEPVLSLAGVFAPRGAPIPSVLDVGRPLFQTAGRFAIALALEAMGLEPGDQVLLPAYHCASMYEPLSWVGAEPVFYRIHDDLSIDLADIERKCSARTKTLVVTHYFGLPQDMPAIRRFCDDAGLLLLEDCAHAFFGQIGGTPLGSFGDYTIASPKKFFPIIEGGLLVSARHRLDRLATRAQPWSTGAKLAFNTVERAVNYGRLPALRPLLGALSASRALVTHARPRNRQSGHNGLSESGAPVGLDRARVGLTLDPFARLILAASPKTRDAHRRLHHFNLLLEGVQGLPGCRPLIPRLPGGAVPYTFPVWIDDLDRVFARLEDMAVPTQRFGQFLHPDVDQTQCPVSAALSKNAVQFPCHQSLQEVEITSILSRLATALKTS
jgi:dTDP-4-amino-4,6-dideoxygalactose transaminase